MRPVVLRQTQPSLGPRQGLPPALHSHARHRNEPAPQHTAFAPAHILGPSPFVRGSSWGLFLPLPIRRTGPSPHSLQPTPRAMPPLPRQEGRTCVRVCACVYVCVRLQARLSVSHTRLEALRPHTDRSASNSRQKLRQQVCTCMRARARPALLHLHARSIMLQLNTMQPERRAASDMTTPAPRFLCTHVCICGACRHRHARAACVLRGARTCEQNSCCLW